MNCLAKISFILVSLLVGLFSNTNVYAQAYNFQELSIQQGLPQSQAYTIIFDSTQHAWIGTQGGGLCRFDGNDFEYFTKSDSLISNRIYCLAQIDNKIWVGQKGGVSILNLKGRFLNNYRLPAEVSVVQDIISFKGKNLIATDRGLYEVSKGQLVRSSENPTLEFANIYKFFVSEMGELWLCTAEGLLSFKDPLKKLNKARGLSANQINCAVTFGEYWLIGTYGKGIDIYSPIEGVLKANPFVDLNECIILSLFVSASDELWIGTLNQGVYVYSRKDGTFRNYQSSNGLANSHVKVITADYWDNVWIGTSGGGVSIFQNSPFVAYSSNSGLNGDYVYAVKNTSKNQLWVATEGKGVLRLNDTSIVTFDEEFGFYSEKVKAIFEDNRGDIWFGTEGKGLGVYSQYDGKDTIYTFGPADGLSSLWVKCFAQSGGRNGKMYIGTSGAGIFEFKGGRDFPLNASFARLKSTGDQIPERINSMDFIQNELWFTGDGNQYGYYFNNKVVAYTETNSSFRNCAGTGNIRWLGSTDNGVLRIEVENDSIIDKRWITTKEGISSNNIYQLTLKENELWVGTEKGLDKINLDSALNIELIEHYGYEEGFEGVETNINAVCQDVNNNLWFGTVDGLYLYQGGEVNYSQQKAPVLQLTDLSLFYESIDSTEYANCFKGGEMVKDLLLPYTENHIGFSFKAIHYTYSKNIRYRWRLEGADPDWTPPSTITTATYSNLIPGDYVFKVKASIDDDWSMEPIEIHFSIDRPYYDKSWFKIMYYSLAVLVLLIVVLIIVFRIKRKNKVLREKFEMEKNLIELEQKALRLQMNPHFIFNVLTSIHNLIILNDPDKARYALSKFSKLMRLVLENSREKFISVDDEIETLENYVQLEKLTSGLDMELEIEMDENFDPAEEILPPLMIQPFVENAIIHGLKEIDYQGKIKVGFKLLSEHLLECYVEDNGRGRAKAAEINAQKENYHKSTALQVTQERLANLNKDANFIPFEIVDLKNDQGKPAGTKVTMRIVI